MEAVHSFVAIYNDSSIHRWIHPDNCERIGMVFWVVIPLLANLISCGGIKTETDDIETVKKLMHSIFLQELGEDLRRKLESISNEGVILGRTNAEIGAMVRSRLTNDEKSRMRKAFEAIAGPAKKFARQRVKGQPVRLTRSSQFKKLQDSNPDTNDMKNGKLKKVKNQRNKLDL